ncbi:Glycosyltransferase [Sandaracinus amylolyticus]|uniref:Glycosyltransferase n=2 Tax=Sandaracinus amylolyticus TaxID=927083 RepID=A0A0F6YNL9_9BACT|nr:Glycosyltransferase [Sandaracinus amylolyticus]
MLARREMTDIVAFTRARWGAQTSREHPLLHALARARRVFVIEAPVRDACVAAAFVEEMRVADGLVVCVPHLRDDLDEVRARAALATLVQQLVDRHAIRAEILWVRAAADLAVARCVEPRVVVWDCDDEPFAPGERALLARADLVLTATHASADARRRAHALVQVMPLIVDASRHARASADEWVDPLDQSCIPGPRLGLAAPIDAHLDVALLARVADALPELSVIALGAPRGIDVRALPCRPNIRWLGEKRDDELPRYIAGWDIGIAPVLTSGGDEPRLALDVMTSGRPVVAASSRDLGALAALSPLARVADRASFVAAIEAALREPIAEHARWAESLRAALTADAACARFESWVADARYRARGARSAELERSSA